MRCTNGGGQDFLFSPLSKTKGAAETSSAAGRDQKAMNVRKSQRTSNKKNNFREEDDEERNEKGN